MRPTVSAGGGPPPDPALFLACLLGVPALLGALAVLGWLLAKDFAWEALLWAVPAWLRRRRKRGG